MLRALIMSRLYLQTADSPDIIAFQKLLEAMGVPKGIFRLSEGPRSQLPRHGRVPVVGLLHDPRADAKRAGRRSRPKCCDLRKKPVIRTWYSSAGHRQPLSRNRKLKYGF